MHQFKTIGEPNSSPHHPDYIPSIFPSVYKCKASSSSSAKLQRYNRRMCRSMVNTVLTSSTNDGVSTTTGVDMGAHSTPLTSSTTDPDGTRVETGLADQADLPEGLQADMEIANALLELSQTNVHFDRYTQTDVHTVDGETQTPSTNIEAL